MPKRTFNQTFVGKEKQSRHKSDLAFRLKRLNLMNHAVKSKAIPSQHKSRTFGTTVVQNRFPVRNLSKPVNVRDMPVKNPQNNHGNDSPSSNIRRDPFKIVRMNVRKHTITTNERQLKQIAQKIMKKNSKRRTSASQNNSTKNPIRPIFVVKNKHTVIPKLIKPSTMKHCRIKSDIALPMNIEAERLIAHPKALRSFIYKNVKRQHLLATMYTVSSRH